MNSAAFKYVVLATVAIRQPFYVDNVCRRFDVEPQLDFDIYPTVECLQVMQRLDIVFRRADRKGGLTLLARTLGKNGAGDDLLRFPPTPADKLTFRVRLRNPDVLNFDDLPVSFDREKLYHFSNQQTDAAAPRDGLHLTAAATGVDGTNDRITSSTGNYSFHHASEVAPGTAKVTHLLTGREVAPLSIVNKAGESDLAFDLSSLPLGKCRLSIGLAVKDELYYVGPFEGDQFGLIELLLANTLAANYRVVEPDRSLASTRPGYLILFRNRPTRWRYTINLLANSPLAVEIAKLTPAEKVTFLSDLKITTNDTAIAFTRTSTTDEEIVFVSDVEIALREKYVSSSESLPLNLALGKKSIGAANTVVVRSDLPYPQNSLIDARAAPPIYSDTFLTI